MSDNLLSPPLTRPVSICIAGGQDTGDAAPGISRSTGRPLSYPNNHKLLHALDSKSSLFRGISFGAGAMSNIEMVIDSTSTSYTYQARTFHKDVFKCLQEFYDSKILCDVEICCGQMSIKCHRLVLACASSYFRTMFTSEMSECHQSKITIQDIEEAALRDLVQFAYTAQVTLTTDNVQALLYAASILQVELVAQACCEFMKTHLHPTNCLGIRAFAEQHGRNELILKADQFTRDHFLAVAKSEEFLSMSPHHLEALLASNDLNVHSEIEVYEAVMLWVKQEAQTRGEHLTDLLGHIKLPLLPPTFLLETVCKDSLVKSNLKCRDYLDEAKHYQLSLAHVIPDFKVSTRMLPRKSYAGRIQNIA